MMARNVKNLQTDLQFLLAHGWKLIDVNAVESPDGEIRTQSIRKAALGVRTKFRAQELIDRKKSAKFLRKHLTKPTFWSRLFT